MKLDTFCIDVCEEHPEIGLHCHYPKDRVVMLTPAQIKDGKVEWATYDSN